MHKKQTNNRFKWVRRSLFSRILPRFKYLNLEYLVLHYLNRELCLICSTAITNWNCRYKRAVIRLQNIWSFRINTEHLSNQVLGQNVRNGKKLRWAREWNFNFRDANLWMLALQTTKVNWWVMHGFIKEYIVLKFTQNTC